jgi:hypothetical protein
VSESGERSGLRRRWLVAGGLLGLVLSPVAAPYREALVTRALRLRRPGADPAAAFREAPCYAYDEELARDAARQGETVG